MKLSRSESCVDVLEEVVTVAAVACLVAVAVASVGCAVAVVVSVESDIGCNAVQEAVYEGRASSPALRSVHAVSRELQARVDSPNHVGTSDARRVVLCDADLR